MTRIFLTIGMAALICQASYAQISNAPLSIPSPNASGIDKYGNVQVSLFHGTPLLSVPIKSISTKKINIPISIQYNGAGVQPDNHPGWVGSNWSLSCGGEISRIVKMGPDEANNAYFNGRGFYFTHDSLNVSNWADTSRIKKFAKRTYEEYFHYMRPYLNPLYQWDDTEPDEFYFNFLGYSGKFFLDHNGSFKVQCDKSVKVIFDTADFIQPFIYGRNTINYDQDLISKTFGKFTLIDEFGYKYIFGTAPAIEYTDEFLGKSMGPDTLGPGTVLLPSRGAFFIGTTWKLKQIIGHDGVELANFNYTRGAFTCTVYSSAMRETTGSGGHSTTTAVNPVARIISPVYLTDARFPLNKLKLKFTVSKTNDLTYIKDVLHDAAGYDSRGSYNATQIEEFVDILNDTTGLYFFGQSIPSAATISSKIDRLMWGKLDKIEMINSISNETIQTIQFNFQDTVTKRLSLQNIQIKDKNLQEISKYAFTYDTTSLPPYARYYNDHGGYFNGRQLPAIYYSSLSYNPNFDIEKATDSVLVKAGILTKIVYPTGGSTEFEYELHDYGKAVNDTKTAVNTVGKTEIGGLRVKRITDKDSNTIRNQKSYYYVRSYSNDSVVSQLPSSGVINAIPKYSLENLVGVTDLGVGFVYNYKSNYPVVPLSTSDNQNFVTYSEVVEQNLDSSYTIYYFTNHDNGHKDLPALDTLNVGKIFHLPTTSLSMQRGKLYKISLFRSDNQKVKESNVEYSVVGDSSTQFGRSIYAQQKRITSSPGGWIFGGSSYKLFYYAYLPAKQIDTTYDGDRKLTSLTISEYDNVYRVMRTRKIPKSNEDSLFTRYSYPFDFDTSSNIYSDMVNAHQIAYPIEQRSIVKKGGSEYLLNATLGTYGEYFPDRIYPDTIFRLNLKTPLALDSISPTAFGSQLNFDSRYKKQEVVHGYEYLGGNPIEYGKYQDLTQSFIWDDSSDMMLAKAINTTSINIAYTSFETTCTGFWAYNGIALTDTTSPTGNKCYYLSDTTILWTINDLSSGTRYVISYWSKNGPYTVSGYSYSKEGPTINGWTYYENEIIGRDIAEFDGQGYVDEVRLYPKNAQMSTYTYKPLAGVTSVCDINNRITRYEYDNFNRLLLIRDAYGNIIKKMEYQHRATPQQ